MNFVNLVHKILTESKPVILPSKVNILIDEILNWVKSLCDPELWNQNKVLFSGSEGKDFYFSNYVDNSHFLHNYKLRCFANVSEHPYGKETSGSFAYSQHENVVIIRIYNDSNGLTLAQLKWAIRHEMMHAFDPALFNRFKNKNMFATSDRTKLEDDSNTYDSYVKYLTKPTPCSGRIPEEFTPRLNMLLQDLSVEKWREFLNDINNKDNTDSEYIKKCLYRLVDVTTFAEVKKHILFGDLTALYHYLRDPYLKRKTLQKIFWFINNHTTQ